MLIVIQTKVNDAEGVSIAFGHQSVLTWANGLNWANALLIVKIENIILARPLFKVPFLSWSMKALSSMPGVAVAITA